LSRITLATGNIGLAFVDPLCHGFETLITNVQHIVKKRHKDEPHEQVVLGLKRNGLRIQMHHVPACPVSLFEQIPEI